MEKISKSNNNHHLATINPKLEQPDPIRPEKPRICLRVRLRAKTPASPKPNPKSKSPPKIRINNQNFNRSMRAHNIDRSLKLRKNPKLAVSGNPDRKMPLSTIAKFSGGTNSSSLAPTPPPQPPPPKEA